MVQWTSYLLRRIIKSYILKRYKLIITNIYPTCSNTNRKHTSRDFNRILLKKLALVKNTFSALKVIDEDTQVFNQFYINFVLKYQIELSFEF